MRASLGQNFLTDDSIAEKIVESAGLTSRDNVLEIGPGKGILTKYLAQKSKRVLAVEIDRDLASSLKAKLKNITVIEGDILKINLPKLIEENNFKNYKVVANLPYYITSKIIRLFLETKYPPSEIILMVQKEVGERIIAADANPRSDTQRGPATGGKESILSISVKFYAEPELLFGVSRENFDPAPEVDSAVVKIKRKKEIPNVDIKKFFSLVRAGFSAKRKMLVNNLSSSFHIPKKEAISLLKKSGLEPGIRAEKLKLENWLKLYQILPSFIAGQKRK